MFEMLPNCQRSEGDTIWNTRGVRQLFEQLAFDYHEVSACELTQLFAVIRDARSHNCDIDRADIECDLRQKSGSSASLFCKTPFCREGKPTLPSAMRQIKAAA